MHDGVAARLKVSFFSLGETSEEKISKEYMNALRIQQVWYEIMKLWWAKLRKTTILRSADPCSEWVVYLKKPSIQELTLILYTKSTFQMKIRG